MTRPTWIGGVMLTRDVSLADNDVRFVPLEDQKSLDFCSVAHISRYTFAAQLPGLFDKVLDFGCGSGYGAHILTQCAGRVDAIDYSPTAIEYAKNTHVSDKLGYYVADATSAESLREVLGDTRYDLITSFDVIEHVDDYFSYLRNARDRLVAGGALVIGCPNRVQTFHWNNQWNPYHMQEFTPVQFRGVLSQYFSQVTLLSQDFSDDEKRERARLSNRPKHVGVKNLVKHVVPGGVIRIMKQGRRAIHGQVAFEVSDIEFVEEPGSTALERAFGLLAICRNEELGNKRTWQVF